MYLSIFFIEKTVIMHFIKLISLIWLFIFLWHRCVFLKILNDSNILQPVGTSVTFLKSIFYNWLWYEWKLLMKIGLQIFCCNCLYTQKFLIFWNYGLPNVNIFWHYIYFQNCDLSSMLASNAKWHNIIYYYVTSNLTFNWVSKLRSKAINNHN